MTTVKSIFINLQVLLNATMVQRQSIRIDVKLTQKQLKTIFFIDKR